MVRNEKWQGHLTIIFTNIIFGLNIPISKSILSGWLSPFALSSLRMMIAAAVFWCISLFLKKEKVRGKDLVILILGAFFGLAGAQISFAFGLYYSSPVGLSLISSMTPIVVMLLAALLLKEPITWQKSAGVVLGVSGALITLFKANQTGSGSNPLLGNFLGIVNIVSYGIYLIIIRSTVQRYSSVTLMKWMFLFSIPFTLPFGFNDLVSANIFTPAANLNIWLRLMFVIIMATAVAYFLIPVGLKRLRPTTVSVYSNIQPIIASTVAIIIGQDLFSWDKPIAAVLVLLGVCLVTQSKSRADTEKQK